MQLNCQADDNIKYSITGNNKNLKMHSGIRNVTLWALLIIVMLFISCSRENYEAEFLSYDIIGEQDDTEIDRLNRTINIRFPEEVLSADNLTAEFTLSDGAMAFVDDLIQVSGQSVNDYEYPFIISVISENEENEIDWSIISTNNSFSNAWGLGGFQLSVSANNKTYDWYIDQFGTGQYSLNNCGPASTTMAGKWSFPAFSKTTADARAAYRPEGGWWYTPDINNYLTDNNIPHSTIGLGSSASSTEQIITAKIDEGYIMILCLDMFYIRNETKPDWRVDRFYNAPSAGWGHFIVVKGYRIIDDQLYFEIYDPYCNGKIYSDGALKGKDRYYRNEDIFTATSIWWNYAIVISEYGGKKSIIDGLDPATIPSMWGR
jgi:hypothetical protein